MFHNGEFFVTHSNPNCVMVFDQNGVYQWDFGRKDLADPRGITVDKVSSSVLVCDGRGEGICIFEILGEFIAKINTPGQWPRNIKLSKDRRNVVVSYLGDHHFQILPFTTYIE